MDIARLLAGVVTLGRAARRKNGRIVVKLTGRAAPACGMMATPCGVVAADLFCLPRAEKLSYISRHELLVPLTTRHNYGSRNTYCP